MEIESLILALGDFGSAIGKQSSVSFASRWISNNNKQWVTLEGQLTTY